MKEGYQLVALGPDRYLEMAAACAASIRHHDGQRPVQLVTDRDEGELGRARSMFQTVTRFHHDNEFVGPICKILLDTYSVFDRTLYVDSDCLLLRDDISRYWAAFKERPVVVLGTKRTSGEWYGGEIADFCRITGAPYLVKTNTGMIYFERGEVCDTTFKKARELYRDLGQFTPMVHRGGISDEPFLAAAIGILGLSPFAWRDSEGNSPMMSAKNGSDWDVDFLAGRSRFFKNKGWAYPSFLHFVGLRPPEIYLRLTNQVRMSVGWETITKV